MALELNVSFKTDVKIKTIQELESDIVALRRFSNSKIVLTSGVFDLVHPGHIDYFNVAKSYGDILVVSIVDDKFVRKGPSRPIFNQELRLKWLAALEVVNYMVLNGDYGPWKVMKVIKPDVYVKGYNPTPGLKKDIALMSSLGGKTIIIPEIMHSTKIFEAINNLSDCKGKD